MAIKGYDIADIPDIKAEWLWYGYIAKGNMTLLASPPKVGKSTLLFLLLKAMEMEAPFLGLPTRRTKILLFTEEHQSLVVDRRNTLGLAPGSIHVVPLQPGLTWKETIAYAKQMAGKGYGLVVYDTLSRYWGLHNENDNAEIQAALDPILALARSSNVALLHIFHDRKRGGPGGAAVRGGNALVGSADIIISFRKMHVWDKSSRRRLEAETRYKETPDILVGVLTEEGYILDDESETNHEQDIISFINTHESATAEQLGTELGLGIRRVQQLLSEMTARGVLERSGSGASRSPYHYAIRNPDSE